jgi:biopolymer transport protein ExbD
VVIESESRIRIDGAVVSPGELYPAMAAAVARHARDPKRCSTHIALVGSVGVPYDAVVRALDAGRQAGDDDVGFVTQ